MLGETDELVIPDGRQCHGKTATHVLGDGDLYPRRILAGIETPLIETQVISKYLDSQRLLTQARCRKEPQALSHLDHALLWQEESRHRHG